MNFFSSWKRLGLSTAPKLTIGGQATDRLKCTWRRPAKDFNEAEHIVYEQHDSVAGTGTHRGYYTNRLKNGDTEYGSFEGTFKTTFKEDGSWEMTTWEGTWKSNGGTGKVKNIKGGGTYRGKATAEEGALTEFEGEVEY